MNPSMTELFPACADVLDEACRPLHYADLTERAMSRLGAAANDEDMRLAKEDVREKMLLAGRYGSAYTGAPEYAGVLRRWFPSAQPEIGNTEAYRFRIPGSAEVGARAAFEAVMRAPHMLTKTSARPEDRWRKQASGLVVEEHVSGWFRREWPEFWRAPDNDGRWDRPCRHDFKLVLGWTTVEVDVLGPRSDGEFGTPVGGGKHAVDLHVAATIDGQDVVLHGFVPGHSLSPRFNALNTQPATRLVVWLNCESIGQDYRSISERLNRDEAA